MTQLQNPIICALDTKETQQALSFSTQLKPHIGAIKLGLEFFTSQGSENVRRLVETGVPVFLDLKFHDIPNTVQEAVRAATQLGVFMMTVHTLGGRTMMQKAAETAQEEASKLGITKPLIVGVTVLTSMDASDLNEIGIHAEPANQVSTLAKLAKDSGLDGIVCSSHEVANVKTLCGKDFKTVVPGIRPSGTDIGDQKRVTTPLQAIENGADFLVVGRPITRAENPVNAAEDIARSLAG